MIDTVDGVEPRNSRARTLSLSDTAAVRLPFPLSAFTYRLNYGTVYGLQIIITAACSWMQPYLTYSYDKDDEYSLNISIQDRI